MKKIMVLTMVTIIALSIAGALFADTSTEENLLGRDIVERGKVIAVSGRLFSDAGEWYLDGKGGEFNLHLGPYGQDNTLGLIEGADADVRGFAVGRDIAVTTIVMNGKKLVYRHDDGKPAWAGSGQGRNKRS